MYKNRQEANQRAQQTAVLAQRDRLADAAEALMQQVAVRIDDPRIVLFDELRAAVLSVRESQ